jgi:hypothetical protein
MVRRLDDGDFRAYRKILEPDDFALSDGEPDPPPTDLISEDVWDGIMTLPDDVAIRTTSFQGDRVSLLHELWAGWIDVLPVGGVLSEASLDVSDDFAASTFNLVHGYYKQAIATLRSALETMVFASSCELTGSMNVWLDWKQGSELKLNDANKNLSALPSIAKYDAKVRSSIGIGMFINPTNQNEMNWIRNLYKRLCGFSHASGDKTNFDLWKSNGPVYSASGMKLSYCFYLETYVVVLILARLTRSNVAMPKEAEVLFHGESLPQYLGEPFAAICSRYYTALFA